MKYREKLLELIYSDDNDDALGLWIESQPLLDQPEIVRELKELITEIELEAGVEQNHDLKNDLDSFADRYEEAILNEKLAEQMYLMALEEQEKASQKIDEAFVGVREYVIECITTNAPNAQEMRKLAEDIINLEKDAGTYDPDNWSAIL